MCAAVQFDPPDRSFHCISLPLPAKMTFGGRRNFLSVAVPSKNAIASRKPVGGQAVGSNKIVLGLGSVGDQPPSFPLETSFCLRIPWQWPSALQIPRPPPPSFPPASSSNTPSPIAWPIALAIARWQSVGWAFAENASGRAGNWAAKHLFQFRWLRPGLPMLVGVCFSLVLLLLSKPDACLFPSSSS